MWLLQRGEKRMDLKVQRNIEMTLSRETTGSRPRSFP
jgi:hypothetical protein